MDLVRRFAIGFRKHIHKLIFYLIMSVCKACISCKISYRRNWVHSITPFYVSL